MTTQAEINFTVHTRENNSFSEQILFDQYERLSNQCRIVYNALKEGKKLTVRDAMLNFGIGDLRRRVADLRESGIEVKSNLLQNRFKEYFL